MGQWNVLYEGNKKGHIRKECGLNNLDIELPLPYAGITQVRYEGRPMMIWTSQQKCSPSLVKSMLALNFYLVNESSGSLMIDVKYSFS